MLDVTCKLVFSDTGVHSNQDIQLGGVIAKAMYFVKLRQGSAVKLSV